MTVMDTEASFNTSRDVDFFRKLPLPPDWRFPVSMINMVKQWHSIEGVWDRMHTEEVRGVPYDRVGLFRLDTLYTNPIDLKDGVAVVPNWGHYGGLNDRLFYGVRRHAEVWAKGRFRGVPSYMKNHTTIHSETFMKWLMRDVRPAQKPICIQRVRANNVIRTNDCKPPDQSGTIVVYSGPTTLTSQMHNDNFEYFLKHGLPSSRHGCSLNVSVIVVLTKTTLEHYSANISQYNASCGEIQTMVREDRCYDMETARTVLASDVLASGTSFSKLVFLDCGMKGPFQSAQNPAFWATEFTNRLKADVKLTGTTIDCSGKLNVHHAHVQSMLWATDRVGLAAIQKAGAIYDCKDQLSTKKGRDQFIIDYQMGLSRAVLKEGYAIQDMTNRTFHWAEAQAAVCLNMWNDTRLVNKYSPESLLFWKVGYKSQAKALSQWQNISAF
jgi:hypothetical protein